MRYQKQIGQFFLRQLANKQISLQEVATRTGYSTKDIQRIVLGLLILPPDEYKRICDACDIDYEDFKKMILEMK